MAPHGETFNAQMGEVDKNTFTSDHLAFEQGGSLTIWLHGIKNDSSHEGFHVNIPECSRSALDPAQTLKTYISHMEHVVPVGRPVFISLRKPFRAVNSATIAKDLKVAISLAGLDGQGFSAKS